MLIKKIAQKKWSKKAAAIAAIVCTLSAASAMAPKAEAFGWLDVVVGGLNAASGYTVVRDMFLTAGDNPVVQNAMYGRQNDTADRPVDERAVELVNDVLTSLIERATTSYATTPCPSAPR